MSASQSEGKLSCSLQQNVSCITGRKYFGKNAHMKNMTEFTLNPTVKNVQ